MAEPHTNAGINDAMDVAQQAVTAAMNGDRGLAANLVMGHDRTDVLALVLVGLVKSVHAKHLRMMFELAGAGEPSLEAIIEGWAAFMFDIEEWRHQ